MSSIPAEPALPGAAYPTPFRPRPGVAALLNLLLAGLGYLYAGRPRRAMVAFLGLYPWSGALLLLSFAAPGAALRVSLLVLILAGLVLILPLDAARVARRSPPAPRRRYQTWYVLLVLWLIVVLAVHGPALAWIEGNVAKTFRISSGSMAPALLAGDYVLASPRPPSPVRRGALVIYRVPDDDHLYTHRVAGLAGDTVTMRDFFLFVNGRPADSTATWHPDSSLSATEDAAFDWQRARLAPGVDPSSYRPTYGTWGPLVLRENEVLVLGDDRPNSLDSRYHGLLVLDDLVGEPKWIYFSREPESGTIRWSRFGRTTEIAQS